MNTKNCRHVVETKVGPTDYTRVVHQLRAAAAARGQSEAHRQWIRAATQC